MNLKDKLQEQALGYEYDGYFAEDVKGAIDDWLLYVKIINLLTANQKEKAKPLEEILMKKYNCKWHELGWEKIFGDFEE